MINPSSVANTLQPMPAPKVRFEMDRYKDHDVQSLIPAHKRGLSHDKFKNMFDYSTPAGQGNKNMYFERRSLKHDAKNHQFGLSYENTLNKEMPYKEDELHQRKLVREEVVQAPLPDEQNKVKFVPLHNTYKKQFA